MIIEVEKRLIDFFQKEYDISFETLKIETPPNKEMGDYAFGCFLLARDLKKSPQIIAEEIAEKFQDDFFVEVKAVGPYVNFFLSPDIYTKALQNFSTNLAELSKIGNNKHIVIDYIGANVGKPMHIGHMCTPNQGQALINVYRKCGYTVIGDSHIGDWGIIFGKLITAYEMYGDDAKLQQDAVEHLLELYIKISAEVEENSELEQKFRDNFKSLASGDKEKIALWKKFTGFSIQAMQVLLDRLNVRADYNIGESFYEGLDLPKLEEYPDLITPMHAIVEELIEKNIATKNDDNSVGIHFPEATKLPSCLLQKRDGTHGYFASDVASIKYRGQNWDPEKIIYCTDSRQQLHFRQAFAVAKSANYVSESTQLVHAYNGFISLKDGAMSTREGRIIKLAALLDEAEVRAGKIIQQKNPDISEKQKAELSKIIGIGAIKYGYLSKNRMNDMIFDWDEFMTFEGKSGPYIQYSYVRGKKILSKNDFSFDENFSPKYTQKESIALIQEILKFPKILQDVMKENFPHILAGYSYDLAKGFSSFYNSVRVGDEEDALLKQSRLQLVHTFCTTLKECFELLGIDMPDEM